MDQPLKFKPLKFKIHTFGCKVNTYDSGLVGKNLKQNGFRDDEDGAQIHVLNSCAVTAEASKQAAREARRLKAKDPFCTVVVTGCAAQVDTDMLTQLPGVDLIVANSHKGELPFILDRYFKGDKEKVFKSNIFKKEDLEAGGGEEKNHTRAFLKIQDGCNSFCTYCVIPFARGKSRSLSVDYLVRRILELESAGVREVVLTGVHIGDYADESAGRTMGLEELLEIILLRTKISRIRLTSLEPPEVTPRLLEVYRNDRMCPHFHMSIQSANSEVLKGMKRNYDQSAVADSLRAIHEKIPGAFVGMDVIVGFPTETPAQFEDTFLKLAELPWTRIHVFPYSERPGTFAARLPKTVSAREIHLRALRLRQLSLERFQKLAAAQKGELKKTLILKSKKGLCVGLTRDYWNVEIPGGELAPGTEISARILSSQNVSAKAMESPLLAEVVS